MFTYISSLLGLPDTHPSTPTLSVITELWAQLPVLHRSSILLAVLHMVANVNPNLPVHPTLPFPCCVHVSILYLCPDEIGSSVPCF